MPIVLLQRRARRRGSPLALYLTAVGLPQPEKEFRFAPPRLWRFDYAWPECGVALEVEGGVFAGGRHTRGAGYRNDLEKYNTATAAGWRILRVLPEQLSDARTIEWLRLCLLPR